MAESTVSPDSIYVPEHLDADELERYNSALELAHLANQVFDIRKTGEDQLLTIASTGQSILSEAAQDVAARYLATHDMFSALVADAATLMPTQDRFKPHVDAAPSVTENEDSDIFLDHNQQRKYAEGEEVANLADQAFDERMLIAEQLITSARQGHNLFSEDVSLVMPHYVEAHDMFQSLVADAAAIFPQAEAFRPKKEILKLANPEVWAQMSIEQRKVAIALRDQWAKGMGEYGVNKDSVRVIMSEDDIRGKVFTLTHVGEGIDFGETSGEADQQRSYREIMFGDCNQFFRHEVDGRTYDSRKGMTAEVYTAMVADAKLRESTVLISHRTAVESFGKVTLMTGEANNGRVMGYTISGHYNNYYVYVSTNSGDPELRFRPAATL
jgi:hypothetical protein